VAHLTELILYFLDSAKFWSISCAGIWLSFGFLKFLLVFILKGISDVSLGTYKIATETTGNTLSPS
jgi:uncharacterized membrane protein